MGSSSKIEWTDTTWNPLAGCTRVSRGCSNCYAEKMTRRLLAMSRQWKDRGAYDRYRRTISDSGRWSNSIALFPERLEAPLRWRKPRRVFVGSMSDLFHHDVPTEYIVQVFVVAKKAERHHFQFLTKRAERLREFGERFSCLTTLPNVSLGVSVEKQDVLEKRWRQLAITPASLRFLSIEPLLAHLDFFRAGSLGAEMGDPIYFSALAGTDATDPSIPGVDQVIVGGESGGGARTCELSWIVNVRNACSDARVPCFVKQLGSLSGGWGPPNYYRRLRDPKGGDPDEWPKYLRVRELTEKWRPKDA